MSIDFGPQKIMSVGLLETRASETLFNFCKNRSGTTLPHQCKVLLLRDRIKKFLIFCK